MEIKHLYINKWLLACSSFLVLFGGKSQSKSKPNIIIIMADDLGYGDMSAYGSTTISTPNFDQLANQGIRFTNGYATSATSTPSRYALMTGLYPWREEKAKILPGDAPLLIKKQQYTLAKLMQDAGYKTGVVGKWHLGMGSGSINWNKRIKPGANETGFDYSCLIAATNDRVPTVYVENGLVVGLDKKDPLYVDYNSNFEGEPTALSHPEMLKLKWTYGHNNSVVNGIPRIGYMKGGKSSLWEDDKMADYFLDKAKTFITRRKEKPFFLYYALHQPHVPRVPNQRFVGTSGMGDRGDAILEVDWCVGEIMKHLQKLKLLDNTIIIFTSDNGPVLNDGYDDKAVDLVGNHKPAGILRGGKNSLFEGGTKVPFVVCWKNHIQSSVSDAMVCQMDLLASFAAFFNLKLKQKSDSKNILSAFVGKNKIGRTDLVLEAMGKLAYRKNDWILIPPYEGKPYGATRVEYGNFAEYQLYNINNDPSQKVNIANEKPLKLDEMKKSFFEIINGYDLKKAGLILNK